MMEATNTNTEARTDAHTDARIAVLDETGAAIMAELERWGAKLYVSRLGSGTYSANINGPQFSVLQFSASQADAIERAITEYRDWMTGRGQPS